MILVRALLVILICACAAPAFGAESEMRYGMHVTLPAKWLDPGDMEAFSTPYMIVYAIHDAMVKPMPAGMQTPSLAESWSEAKDHLSYTFTLEAHVKAGVLPATYATSADPERPVPAFVQPEKIGIVVAGDPGRNQSKGYVNNHIQGGRISRKVDA